MQVAIKFTSYDTFLIIPKVNGKPSNRKPIMVQTLLDFSRMTAAERADTVTKIILGTKRLFVRLQGGRLK